MPLGLIVLFGAIPFIAHAQNSTYYYERVKVIKQGNQQSSSGDGHYLSINQNGLYESTASGGSMNKGFVKYVNSNNGLPLYEGSAYLGQNLSYVFNSDYSRLNLHLLDGTIYVYERRNAPSSNSAMRIYHSDPVIGPIPEPSDNPKGHTKETPQRQENRYITCTYCNGTGRRLNYVDGGLQSNQFWITCNECGMRYLNSSIHRHVKCHYCNGTGKRRL